MKSAHKAIRARVDAITPKNAPDIASELDREERRTILVKQSKSITQELLGYPKGSKQRKSLGQSLLRVNQEIAALRPKRKCPGSEHWFIDAAMEILPETTTRLIWDRAVALKETWGKNQEPGERKHPWKDDAE